MKRDLNISRETYVQEKRNMSITHIKETYICEKRTAKKDVWKRMLMPVSNSV